MFSRFVNSRSQAVLVLGIFLIAPALMSGQNHKNQGGSTPAHSAPKASAPSRSAPSHSAPPSHSSSTNRSSSNASRSTAATTHSSGRSSNLGSANTATRGVKSGNLGSANTANTRGGKSGNLGSANTATTHGGKSGNLGSANTATTHGGKSGNLGSANTATTHGGKSGNLGSANTATTHGGKSGMKLDGRSGNTGSANTATHGSASGHSAYHVDSSHVAGKGSNNSQVLTKGGSQAVLSQVNTTRHSMSGFNSKPLPNGNVTVQKNGNLSLVAAGNRHYNLRSDGTLASYSSQHHSVNFRADGRVASMHSGNMHIVHGVSGERFLYTRRADRTVLYSRGAHYRYMERPWRYRNVEYMRRTYFINGVVYNRVYANYYWRGVWLPRYVPRYYYAPAFYGWAYSPWYYSRPVVYRWGWYSDPWYSYYGNYYTPYPSYVSPSAWLTDYMLAETLRMAFLSRPAAVAPAAPVAYAGTPISPEVKLALAEEVRHQLEYERTAAASGAPSNAQPELAAVLRPGKMFIVSDNLDVTAGDQECGLSAGDILQLPQVPGEDSPTADLRVVSSKGGDCRAGSNVTLSMNDLQTMHNNFREQIDSGLSTLQAKQGKDGLPAAPADALGAPRQNIDVGETNLEEANQMFAQQQQEADQAEKQAVEEAFSSQGQE